MIFFVIPASNIVIPSDKKRHSGLRAGTSSLRVFLEHLKLGEAIHAFSPGRRAGG